MSAQPAYAAEALPTTGPVAIAAVAAPVTLAPMTPVPIASAPSVSLAPPPAAHVPPSPRTPIAEVSAKLRTARPAIVRGHLFVRGIPATGNTLNALKLQGVTPAEIVRARHALGLREVDRVLHRPIMTSWGQIAERGFVFDEVHGRPDRAQIIADKGYSPVPAKAPPLPPWNQDVFSDQESALVYAAFVCALAAPRSVTDVGIVSVKGRSEKAARALVDIAAVLATGSEAPITITLGESPRDFLNGVSGPRAEDDDEDEDEDEDDVDEADESESDDDGDEVTLGPDPVLGLCVLRGARELVRAHPTCPIVLLNMAADDLDPAAPVHHIELRRDLYLDHEEVELAHISHSSLYVECLARVRDAGAPITFDRLLQYLRRTSSTTT